MVILRNFLEYLQIVLETLFSAKLFLMKLNYKWRHTAVRDYYNLNLTITQNTVYNE